MVAWLAAYGMAAVATTVLFRKRRDVTASIAVLPLAGKGFVKSITILLTYYMNKWNNKTVCSLIEQRAKSHPNKVFCYFENEAWTYERINCLANQVANYFAAKGYKKGDVVGVVMENCPENICVWLGLSKIGVIASIVNNNLRCESLKETLKVGEPKAVIFHASTAAAIGGVLDLEGDFDQELYCLGQSTVKKAVDLTAEFDAVSEENPRPKESINFDDDLFWLYTSGSTGLPKAVPFRHSRYLITGYAVSKFWGVNDKDMVYVYLPLYHGAGVAGGVAVTLNRGASMLLRKKFSASKFWKDCVEYDVTVCQYIGEICRYLLRQPEVPEEKKHKVKLFYGNGLRVEIWESFVNRFKIPKIGEFFGSTEVNAGLFNLDNTVGAIGFIPRWLFWMVPASLIKVDEDTMEPIRDPKTGLCIQCGIDEPGEWVSVTGGIYKIVDFHGYKNSDSKKKILRNVFRKGDTCFRSEDILVMDKYGYFRFKDRAALNYRWKGENISAIEVENTISRLIGLKDVAAYGVKIPECDGYPGMAVIADPNIDLGKLLEEMKEKLPSYAIPLFIRLAEEIETTGTYKTMKKNFIAEGYDINKIQDKMYFLQNGKKYTPLDKKLYEDIMSGKIAP